MEMKFDIYQISEENKENFVPKKGHLSNFEQWAMIKAYCELYDLLGPDCVSDFKLQGTCVWDDKYLYNVFYQATKEPDCITRLWLTESEILMLEICYNDMDKPNKLYRCD